MRHAPFTEARRPCWQSNERPTGSFQSVLLTALPIRTLSMNRSVWCPPFRVSGGRNTLKRGHQTQSGGSWSQCASECWRWRLPTNRKVGLGVLTPPPDLLDTSDGRGGVRTPSPTRLWRFGGSKHEVLFRRILTLILSTCEGGRKKPASNPVAFGNSGQCPADGRYRISSPLIG